MTAPAAPIRLYTFPYSGHAHRADLMLSLLGLPYERINVDLTKGAQREAGFLSLNPFGQVPVIEDGATVLADSNAILVYLATRYDDARTWLPRHPVIAARVQQWLSVAAGQLAFGPAMARLGLAFGRDIDLARAQALAAQLYGLVDRHLADTPFLVGAQPTIADIALYSYTAVAPEGGVAVDAYPNIRAWLGRIEALPRFVPMPAFPKQG